MVRSAAFGASPDDASLAGRTMKAEDTSKAHYEAADRTVATVLA
jgi:hypothetical protein